MKIERERERLREREREREIGCNKEWTKSPIDNESIIIFLYNE